MDLKAEKEKTKRNTCQGQQEIISRWTEEGDKAAWSQSKKSRKRADLEERLNVKPLLHSQYW